MSDYNLFPCPECHRPAQQPEITFASKRKPDFSATVRCSRCNYRVEAEGVTEEGATSSVAKLWGVLITQNYQTNENAKKTPAAAEQVSQAPKGGEVKAVGTE